jgi:2-aminoadipate transaminase
MRLNFSGVPEDQIREGVRRIGEVIREQVAMYGTLTGATAAVAPAAEPVVEADGAKVLPLRAQRRRTG